MGARKREIREQARLTGAGPVKQKKLDKMEELRRNRPSDMREPEMLSILKMLAVLS